MTEDGDGGEVGRRLTCPVGTLSRIPKRVARSRMRSLAFVSTLFDFSSLSSLLLHRHAFLSCSLGTTLDILYLFLSGSRGDNGVYFSMNVVPCRSVCYCPPEYCLFNARAYS